MARSAVVLFLPLILSSVLSLASPGVLSANTNPEHEQFVAYWTLEPGWHSEFQLRNNMLGKELTVKPFLRTSDGSEVALDPIVIPQDDVRMIDLRAAVKSVAPQLVDATNSFGSVVFRYQSPSEGNLYASVMLQLDGNPISFHLDAMQSGNNSPLSNQDGIWWQPHDSMSQFLVLSNYADKSATVTLVLFDSQGREGHASDVLLAPRQTARIDLPAVIRKAGITGSYGGLCVRYPKPAEVYPEQFAFDESSGFSALMKLFDHYSNDAPSLVTLRAPMIALSTPDPALRLPSGTTLIPTVPLRNTTGSALAVRVVANWRNDGASGQSVIPVAPIRPQETRVLDLSKLQTAGIIPQAATWTALAVSYQGQEGDLVALANSYDSLGKYGLQSPFSSQLAASWKGGIWRADTNMNSLIAVGNGGSKPTKARVGINYEGGSYDLRSRSLAPGEQFWIDVGQIKQNQVPDARGRVFPITATSGTYEIEDMNDSYVGSLYEGKLTVDKTFGHAAYGCAVCCTKSPIWIEPYPLFLGVGGTTQCQLYATDSCTGGTVETNGGAATWSSTAPSVATINTNALVAGVAFGSSTIKTSLITRVYGPGGKVDRCVPQTVSASAPVTVGQTMQLVGVGCLDNPTYPYSGNYNHIGGSCFKTANFPLPTGGACINVGTTPDGTPKRCYQTNVNGCSTTYCVVNYRVADSACTKFIDQAGYTETKVPAGCQ